MAGGFALPALARDPIVFRIDWENTIVPKPSVVSSGNLEVFEFPDGLTRSLSSESQIRDGVLISANPVLDAQFAVTTNGAGNADVRLQLQITYIAVGELTTKAVDETVLLTCPVIDTFDQLHTCSFQLDKSLVVGGEVAQVVLSRLGGDGADTFTGKVGILKTSRITVM